jgi:glycolate oxidase
METSLLSELKQAVGGDGRISTAPEDLVAYAYDGTWAEERPEVVIHPQTTEQVAAVLRIADEKRIPVVPRGAATGRAGAAVPVQGSICLNMARMNRILEISTADMLAVAEPGVVTYDLQKGGRKIRPDVPARSSQFVSMHHRRQRGDERRRAALPQIWRHR